MNLAMKVYLETEVPNGCECQASSLCLSPADSLLRLEINPLNAELNPICYLLEVLGAHHFLHVSRIRVKLLTFRLLMSYICSTYS